MRVRKHPPGEPDLFGESPAPATSRTSADGSTSAYVLQNGERLRRWASKGISFGTSSWKYPGWKGMVYNRPYPSKKIFDQECIAEYSGIFPTVCADFALYDFPDPSKMQLLHDLTTEDFTVSLKVTDRITIKRYPNLPRHGAHAGTDNADFLNAELFKDAFLTPLDQLKKKVGAVIFEFAAFYPSFGMSFDEVAELLDNFLGRLPKNFTYAVEVRNKEFLTKDYFAMLQSHGVAHVLNNWTHMPPIIEQLQCAGVLTAPFVVARALLKPGRTYNEAVERFQPYEEIKEENPDLRRGLVETVHRCIAERRKLYAYVNNRAEGNSPKTIEAILDILDSYPVEKL